MVTISLKIKHTILVQQSTMTMEMLTNIMNAKNLVNYLQRNHYPNSKHLIQLSQTTYCVSSSWLKFAESTGHSQDYNQPTDQPNVSSL